MPINMRMRTNKDRNYTVYSTFFGKFFDDALVLFGFFFIPVFISSREDNAAAEDVIY